MESTPSMQVRAARSDDVPALADLSGQLGYPTTVDQMARRMARIAAAPDRATFVAVKQGLVVGYVGVWIGQSYGSDQLRARVDTLVVAETARGTGIGATLMEVVEGWGRDRGAGAIVLTTGNTRSGAHAFYERLGYVDTGRRYTKSLRGLGSRGADTGQAFQGGRGGEASDL